MNKYEGQKFSKVAFVAEDSYFVNCVLTDCDLFFSGGEMEWANTRFENCRWHWRGAAGLTVRLLMQLGMMKAQSIPQQFQASSSKPN
jgi:hypothetical protein